MRAASTRGPGRQPSPLVDGSGGATYHRGEPAGGASGEVSPTPGPAPGNAAVPVQMELSRIIISENNEQQIIYLREVDGERSFPIVIGLFEATSIDRRIRGQSTTRPMTHDLLASAIEHLGGEVQDIYISELRDHTYFAKLRIKHDGELIEVDSRPSDAIAVAVTVDAPIYVAEDVLEEAGQQ